MQWNTITCVKQCLGNSWPTVSGLFWDFLISSSFFLQHFGSTLILPPTSTSEKCFPLLSGHQPIVSPPSLPLPSLTLLHSPSPPFPFLLLTALHLLPFLFTLSITLPRLVALSLIFGTRWTLNEEGSGGSLKLAAEWQDIKAGILAGGISRKQNKKTLVNLAYNSIKTEHEAVYFGKKPV